MTSETRVNGVVHTDKVTIYCVDSMPVFNHDGVRQGMMNDLDSSGVPTKPYTQRTERAFFVLQDTTSSGSEPFIYFLPLQPDADGCWVGSVTPDFSSRPAGTKILGWGHDHVIPVDSAMVCKDSTGNYEVDADSVMIVKKAKIGISPEDWQFVFDRNQPTYSDYVGPINHYVITADGDIWIVRPGQLPGAPVLLPANNLKWRKGRCAWPKRT